MFPPHRVRTWRRLKPGFRFYYTLELVLGNLPDYGSWHKRKRRGGRSRRWLQKQSGCGGRRFLWGHRASARQHGDSGVDLWLPSSREWPLPSYQNLGQESVGPGSIKEKNRNKTKEDASQPNYDRRPAHCGASWAWFQSCVQASALSVPPIKRVSHALPPAYLQGFPRTACSLSLPRKEGREARTHWNICCQWLVIILTIIHI